MNLLLCPPDSDFIDRPSVVAITAGRLFYHLSLPSDKFKLLDDVGVPQIGGDDWMGKLPN